MIDIDHSDSVPTQYLIMKMRMMIVTIKLLLQFSIDRKSVGCGNCGTIDQVNNKSQQAGTELCQAQFHTGLCF